MLQDTFPPVNSTIINDCLCAVVETEKPPGKLSRTQKAVGRYLAQTHIFPSTRCACIGYASCSNIFSLHCTPCFGQALVHCLMSLASVVTVVTVTVFHVPTRSARLSTYPLAG